MSVKLKLDDVITIAAQRGFVVLSKEYTNSDVPVEVRCMEGHITRKRIGDLRRYGCSGCLSRTLSEKQAFDYEEVVAIAETMGFCVEGGYTNRTTKGRFRCVKCEYVWRTSLGNLQKYGSCPKCSERRHRPSSEDICHCLSKEGYEVVSGDVVSAKSRIVVKCTAGHLWQTTWDRIKRGIRCKECGIASMSKKMRFEDSFVEAQIASRGGMLLTKGYLNTTTALDVRCDKGHIFHPTLKSVLKGHWCSRCKFSKGQEAIMRVIEQELPRCTVNIDYRGFDWLKTGNKTGKQELDIWIPELKLAIEYDGEQHFRPVSVFGGEEGFERTKARDAMKNVKVAQHTDDISYFVRFSYMDDLSRERVIDKLRENGVPI
jgi:hypothetical protein